MRNKIEYIIVKSLIKIANVIPKNSLYSFLKIVSLAVFKLEKRRSSLTIKNLKLAFPQKSDKEILQIAKDAYKSVAISIAEILLIIDDKLDINDMVSNKEEAIRDLKEYQKDAKNGTILLSAHYSNWELAALFLSKNGFKCTTIGRKGNNELIESHITTPFRERYGSKNVHKKNAMLAIIKTLKKNGNVGILIDQKAGGNESVKTLFFGREVDTVNSVAILKLKYNPLIIPIFAVRENDGRYKIQILKPIEYKAKELTNKEDKIKQITQKYNDAIESIIREHPGQWFWMHNRWRIS